MDFVLFYPLMADDRIILTGAVFDAFEYYIALFERKQDIRLVLLDCPIDTKQKLIDICEDRYNLDDLDYKPNIIVRRSIDLLNQRGNFHKVLVVDMETVKRSRDVLHANQVVYMIEKHWREIPEYTYPDELNVITFGEMPFVLRDHEYRCKLLFHRFKELKNVKEGIYINSPHNQDRSYVKTLNIPEKHRHKPIIFKERDHLWNLFEQFDCYIYAHGNRWFDPHPRLFLEAAFYKKDFYLTYLGRNVRDGAWYRYHDACNFWHPDPDRFYFSDNDEIIKLFCN